MTSTAAEIKRQQQLRAMQRHEEAHDLVPGSCSMKGNDEPTGGVEWEGAARMALARQHAELPLSDKDVEALRRHPHPRSSWTGTALT